DSPPRRRERRGSGLPIAPRKHRLAANTRYVASNVSTSFGVLGVSAVNEFPVNIWRTIRGYVLWTYERGSVHYDVMVTLILAFIFLAPHWINFKDKPVEHTPHQTGVVVTPDGENGFIYQVEASAVNASDDASIRE